MIHGEFFSQSKWEQFLGERAVSRSGVSFPEIEVLLCDIPSVHDMMEEERERQRLERGRSRGWNEVDRGVGTR